VAKGIERLRRALREQRPAPGDRLHAYYRFMAPRTLVEHVGGMTCHSCEQIIQRELGALPNVIAVNADSKRGRVSLTVSGEVDRDQMAHVLAAHSYRLGERATWLTRERAVWGDVTIAIVALTMVIGTLWALGLDTALASLASSPSVGLIVPLTVGLAAGVSTCMATVGGLVLAMAAQHSAQLPPPSRRSTVVMHAWFNVARIAGFVGLGAVTGAVGSLFALNGVGLTVAMITAALVMTIIGVRLSGLSPRVAAMSPQLPGWIVRRFQAKRRRSPTSSRSRNTRAGLLGLASFFVPCGFTQAMQVYALSTGDPLEAGLIMGAFALGTAPALAALAGVPLLSSGRRHARTLRFAGVAVLAFAAMNVAAVLSPISASVGIPQAAPLTISDNVAIEDGVQVMQMTIDGYDYLPQHSVVYAGIPVRWEIDGNGVTCASALLAPELGIPVTTIVWPDQPATFTFTLDKPGRVEFSCSMQMYFGSVTAIAPTTS
jgi:sulfite exporter TauE/SafE/copper chaperone CopZ